MNKLKNFIHKIKSTVYGALGRAQAAAEPAIDEAIEKIVEAIDEQPAVVETKPEPDPVAEPVQENCVTAKKIPAKKKPGRPKGSQNPSKESQNISKKS